MIREFIRHALQSQIGSGGLLLLLSGAALGLMRSIPGRLVRLAKRLSIVEVEVRNRRLIETIAAFVAETQQRRLRIAKANLEYRHDGTPTIGRNPDDNEVLQIEAGYGVHFIRYAGRPIMLTRTLKKDDGLSNPGSVSDFLIPSDVLTLRTLARDAKSAFTPFIEAAREHARAKVKKKPELFLSNGYSAEWYRLEGFSWRSMESVILPGSLGEELVREIGEFLAAQKVYSDLGIPWRYGLLLEGEPGTGKSSLASALAGEFTLPVYCPVIRDKGLGDANFARLMASVPPRSILLIEDVDCVQPSREAKDDSNGVTLSGILNGLDGATATEGRILIMTTNRPEALDAAMTRDGRVDRRIYLGPATEDQAERVYLRFHPGETAAAAAFGREMAGQTMASIQGKLLRDGGGSVLRLVRSAK